MELPMELLIVSNSPILGRGLRHLLDRWPTLFRSRMVIEQVESPTPPDALLVAPQSWEEMAFWLPTLRKRYAFCPWLLLADVRVAGMFLSLIQPQPCLLVGLEAAPESLEQAADSLASRRGFCLSSELCARFARGADLESVGRWRPSPSARELQCGCAVSLGLCNRRIAEVLHVSEATVKTHLHHFMGKLDLSNRWELGAFVQRALAAPTPPVGATVSSAREPVASLHSGYRRGDQPRPVTRLRLSA